MKATVQQHICWQSTEKCTISPNDTSFNDDNKNTNSPRSHSDEN